MTPHCSSRYSFATVAIIVVALFFPLGLFCWKRSKQQRLKRKIEKELEENPDVGQMPVLLKYPSKVHFEKSA
jgi:hypothetical protein